MYILPNCFRSLYLKISWFRSFSTVGWDVVYKYRVNSRDETIFVWLTVWDICGTSVTAQRYRLRRSSTETPSGMDSPVGHEASYMTLAESVSGPTGVRRTIGQRNPTTDGKTRRVLTLLYFFGFKLWRLYVLSFLLRKSPLVIYTILATIHRVSNYSMLRSTLVFRKFNNASRFGK